jgi:hypothetical protein
MKYSFENKILLGWREWVSLPGLGIPAIKAKVDTGARTSSLHAFQLETFREKGQRKVRFGIHPLQRRNDITIWCVADVLDYRRVSDSGGHREMRYVINTPVCIGSMVWDAEITLTDRETMQFRMLLGRTAMVGRFAVDPEAAYLTGRTLRHAYGPGKKRKKS